MSLYWDGPTRINVSHFKFVAHTEVFTKKEIAPHLGLVNKLFSILARVEFIIYGWRHSCLGLIPKNIAYDLLINPYISN